MTSEGTKYSAPAAACAAQVLRLLGDSQESLSLTELERATGRTKSLLFRTLQELVRHEFVHRSHDRRYSLGIAAFEAGAAYLAKHTNRDTIRRVLRDLADSAGQSTNLSILRGCDALYLMKFQGPTTHVTISRVGGRVPATCTASGKALLASLEPEEVRHHVRDPLDQMTPWSIATFDELIEDLRDVRERGYARDVHEAVQGRAGLAVTVSFPEENDCAAISLSTDAASFESTEQHLLGLLLDARERIQRDATSRDAIEGPTE